jgi:hypothetical protein
MIAIKLATKNIQSTSGKRIPYEHYKQHQLLTSPINEKVPMEAPKQNSEVQDHFSRTGTHSTRLHPSTNVQLNQS